MKETGLFDLLSNRIVKDLVDYVLGVEVGLDSNGRIQCGSFKSLNRSIFIDKMEYSGTICDQIDCAYKFVRNYLQVGLTIHDIVSFEKMKYQNFHFVKLLLMLSS